jgi:hypothetical protein
MRTRTICLFVALAVTTIVGPSSAMAVDPTFRCLNDDTASNEATPWFDAHYDLSWSVSRSMLDVHIPQGLGTWADYYGAGRDLVVMTAYSQLGGRARLSGIDPADGSKTNYVNIRGGHAGGVAVVGGWVYVPGPDDSSGKTIYRYRAATVADAFAGRTSPAFLDGALAGHVTANSFVAADGTGLFIGSFNPDGLGSMARYALQADGDLGARSGYIEVPKKTQGLHVLQNYFVFSTSEGRNNRSNIYVVRRGYSSLQSAYDDRMLRCVRIPTMSEGVTGSGGVLYQLFESGADCYANDEDPCDSTPIITDRPDRIITNLYSIPRTTLIDGLPVFRGP